MANLNGFNPADYEDEGGFGPVPAGTYVAVIKDSEMRTTRDGSGQYLKLTWEIIEGPQSRRLVWENINLVNRNPEAVRIAKKTLARVSKACGINRPLQDSSELHGKPVKIKVTVRPASNGYDESNDVKGHAPTIDAPQQAAPAAAAAQAPASGSGVTPPWYKEPGNQDSIPF
jgi:hypothetical protein